MSRSEIEQIKADLGVNSRRLISLYNENTGADYSAALCEAGQKADAAYEAIKQVLEQLPE